MSETSPDYQRNPALSIDSLKHNLKTFMSAKY